MTTNHDKPLTAAEARQKIQKGLDNYLAGNDPRPIVFRLKRSKPANEIYPLKLTVQQRKTLLQFTDLNRNLKKKIEQPGAGIVGVTWKELNTLNDETGQAAVYAPTANRKYLMAVQKKVVRFFEEEYAELFDAKSSTHG